MIWFVLGWMHGFSVAVWLMGWVNAASPGRGRVQPGAPLADGDTYAAALARARSRT